MRALLETLSRLDRHRDVAALLGALAASSRATDVSGADSARVAAVERAARAALGAEFEPLRAAGAALGDAGSRRARPPGDAGGREADTGNDIRGDPSGLTVAACYPTECDHPVAR